MKYLFNMVKLSLQEEISRIKGLIYEITSVDAKERYYKSIDDVTYNRALHLDPTYNRSTDQLGKYVKWLLLPKNVSIIQQTRDEDLYKIKDDLVKYDKLKQVNKLSPEYKDINLITITQLGDYIFDNFSNVDVNSMTSQTQDIKKVKEDVEKYSVGDFTIISPQTQESACLYGKGTRWCTAADNHNRFDFYKSRGELWILINDRNPAEKYQFHFEEEQFKDVRDSDIDALDFFNDNPDLYDFFSDIYPSLDYILTKISIDNGYYDDFQNYYSNKFSDDEKESLVDKILDKIYDEPYYDVETLITILYDIDIDLEVYKNSSSSMLTKSERNYRNALESILSAIKNDDDEQFKVINFIKAFGGLSISDVEILYDNLYDNHRDIFYSVIGEFGNGESLLNDYIEKNDLYDNFDRTKEMLSFINKLRETYPSYPVLESKLVIITIKQTNYNDGTFTITLEKKGDSGTVSMRRGKIKYNNIYTYLNNYSLFDDEE